MAKDISTTIVLKVSGKEAENSFQGLNKLVKGLEAELRKLTPGTEEFIKKAAELKEAREQFNRVKAEIDAVNGRLQQSEGFFGTFKTKLADIGLSIPQVLGGFLAFSFFQKAEELIKVSDAMSDVQKTTGLALDEVKGLWDAFDEMDTRTSKMDRLKIAEVGGRLGVPKEELKDFVQEVDKAFVALGDSFQGGLENVVDSLGKIKGLFAETQSKSYAEAIKEIGSALNDLAASGTASEGNIADFALRVGALPDAMKPSVSAVLGLGAAFEESGVDSQIAASGFSNFMKVAGENITTFAQSMHMGVEEAQKLYNEKPEEFFLRFAAGMKGLDGTQTAKVFDSLKINSLEVQKAIGAAANRTDDFVKSLNNSKSAMASAISLQNEFNVKNNNSAAVIEKLKNAFSELFTKSNILNSFDWLIKSIGWLTGVTSEASDGIYVFKERMKLAWDIIKVVTLALVGYKTTILIAAIATGNYTKAKWLSILADKASAVQMAISRGAILLYAAAKFLLAGNITKATQAMRLFSIATKMNPLGLLIGLLTAAYTAYETFSDKVDEVARKQRLFNDIKTETAKKVADERFEIEKLVATINNERSSNELRANALKKINDIIPDHIGLLTLQNIKTAEGTEIINNYIKALEKKMYAETVGEKRKELYKKQLDIQGEEIKPSTLGKIGNWIDEKSGYKGKMSLNEAKELDAIVDLNEVNKRLSTYTKVIADEYLKRRNKLRNNYKELSAISQEHRKLMRENISDIDTNSPTNSAVPDPTKKPKVKKIHPDKDDSLKKSQEELKKSIENLDKYDKKKLELVRKYEDEKLAIIEESAEKERKEENIRHKRAIEDINNENEEKKKAISEAKKAISNLEKERNKTKNPEAKANYNATIQAKRTEIDKLKDLISQNNRIKEQMEQTHQFKLKTIDEKAWAEKYSQEIAQRQKEITDEARLKEEQIQNISTMEEAEIALSKIKYLKLTDQELKGIKTLEDAKKALRENAHREVLELQLKALDKDKKSLEEHLKELTGSAAEKLKKDLDKLNQKITQVKSAIQGGDEADAKKVTEEKENAKEKIDILGFSAKDWDKMFNNLNSTSGKIAAVGMAAKALSNAFSQFGELQKNLNERELRHFTKNQDKKRKALLQQLNQGYINQEEYHKALEELEKKRLNKQAEMQYKEAKMQKVIRIADAVSATALGVANALKLGPMGIPLAVLIGALGAVQVGIIASQPLPEQQTFAQGGYTGDGFGSPDASGHRPAGIVHESEYVTPKWMLENPVVADVVDWMESIRIGRTALPQTYAEGGFASINNEDLAMNRDLANSQVPTISDPQLTAVLGEVRDLLSDLKENGVDAFMIEDAENGKRLKRTIKMFEKLEQKNARK